IGRDARAKPDVGIHAWIALFTWQMLDYICSQQCYGAADIPYFNARNASNRYVGGTGTNTAEKAYIKALVPYPMDDVGVLSEAFAHFRDLHNACVHIWINRQDFLGGHLLKAPHYCGKL